MLILMNLLIMIVLVGIVSWYLMPLRKTTMDFERKCVS